MPRATALFDHPFIGGYRSDFDSWSLRPNQFREGQDVIWPRGVACLRGGWANVGAANVFGSAAGDEYGGVFVHRFDPEDSTEVSVVVFNSSSTNQMGFADGAGEDITGAAPFWTNEAMARASYLGEVIICPQNGVDSDLRLGTRTFGPYTSLAGGGDTLTATDDSPVITGSGTTWTTEAYLGAYIGIGWLACHGIYRIVRVDSNTQLAVDRPVSLPSALGGTFTSSGASSDFFIRRTGWFGPCSIIQDQGDATFPATAATDITGRGTSWSAATAPNGSRVNARALKDIVGQRGSWAGLTAVSSVTSDTALNIEGYSTALTNKAYAVAGNLVGREACVHQGQLFVANLAWAPNRLQWLVPGESPSKIDNGNDSLDTNYLDARLADFQEVPDRNSPGGIECLQSVPEGPLLILRSTDSYLGWGLGGATFEVDLLDADAGCADKRSGVVGRGGAYWVGHSGVYRYTGGRSVDDLSRGHINRELRALMTDFDPSSDNVAGVIVDGHYVIAVDSSQGTKTFAYNIDEQNWSPNMSGMTFRAAARAEPLTDPDSACYIAVPSQRQLGDLSGTFRDDGAAATGSHLGTFQATLPMSAAANINRLVTPTDVKVTGHVIGADVARLDIRVGNSNVPSPDVSGTLDDRTTATGMDTVLVEPEPDVSVFATSALGLEGRDAFVKLAQAGGGSPSAVRVEAIEVQVRQRRSNA